MTNQEQYDNMTCKQWVDLLSEKFNVSRTSAKVMLHLIMQVKKIDNLKKERQANKK